MKLDRKSDLSVESFVEDHLKANVPVIITDAMDTWAAKDLWTPEYLEREFGEARVQVYNDLFMLIGVRKLKDYFHRYFGRNPDEVAGRRPGYVRWYTRLSSEDRVPWADDLFERMKDQWATPLFHAAKRLSAALLRPGSDHRHAYLAVSSPGAVHPPPRGARTALHADPWGSDAVLCQVHGWKTLRIYSPDQKPYLTQGRKAVDLDDPDLQAFPDFPKAKPTFEDEAASRGMRLLSPRGGFTMWARNPTAFHSLGTSST